LRALFRVLLLHYEVNYTSDNGNYRSTRKHWENRGKIRKDMHEHKTKQPI